MSVIKEIIKEEITRFLKEGKEQLVDYFANVWVLDKNTINTINSSNFLKSKYGSYLTYSEDEWNMMSEEDLLKIWHEWDADYMMANRNPDK